MQVLATSGERGSRQEHRVEGKLSIKAWGLDTLKSSCLIWQLLLHGALRIQQWHLFCFCRSNIVENGKTTHLCAWTGGSQFLVPSRRVCVRTRAGICVFFKCCSLGKTFDCLTACSLKIHQGHDPFAAAATGDACPSDDTARVMLIAAEMYEVVDLGYVAMLWVNEKCRNRFPLVSQKLLHPWSLTWNLKISPWKRSFLLESIILRFHAKLKGCRWCFETFFNFYLYLGRLSNLTTVILFKWVETTNYK